VEVFDLLCVDCIWKNEKICASILAAADIQKEKS